MGDPRLEPLVDLNILDMPEGAPVILSGWRAAGTGLWHGKALFKVLVFLSLSTHK